MAEILPLTTGVVVAAVLAALLLIVSGLASGSEIAIFSLSPTDVSELDPEKRSTDEMIQCLREDSERTLATILIANNFVNVTIIMLFNYVFSHLVVFKFRTTELFVVLSACGKLHYVLQETLLAHGECAAQQWLLS